MIRIAVALALAVPLTAAAEAPDGSSASALCLSDGQTLSGVQIAQDDAHRTVRIGDNDVQIPNEALSTDCSALRVSETSDPFKLKTITLVDGQRLYGTPIYRPGMMTLALLDEQRIHVPEAAVSHVDRLDRGPEALDPVHQQRTRTKAKKALGIAADVGLGLLGAAVVGGTTYGIVVLTRPDE
jgi:hypothetical protein